MHGATTNDVVWVYFRNAVALLFATCKHYQRLQLQRWAWFF